MESNPSETKGLVTVAEFDARLLPIERSLVRIEQRLDQGADRGLDVLRLVVSVVVPACLALAAWVNANDRIVSAESSAQARLIGRDLYWIEKNQNGMWSSISDARSELNERSGRIASLESFTDKQEKSNERQQDRLDRLDESASIDKDQLERDALNEIRNRLERLEGAQP